MKLLFYLLSSALLGTATAREIVVTAASDSGPGSLRQAVTDAVNGDSIQFGLIGPITLTSGELTVDQNIRIKGSGIEITRGSAARFRIFHVMPGRIVSFSGLTISNGYADASFGAGILNEGVLTISKCTVTDNFSDSGDGGGGIYSTNELYVIASTISFNRAGFTIGLPLGYGGGIRSGGLLTVVNSTISNNVADVDGGGVNCYGSIVIRNSTIADNRAGTIVLGPGDGGGIYNGGGLRIANTILKSVAGWGPSIFNTEDGAVHSLGYNLSNDGANGLLVGAGDQVNVDPMLGPLQNNGGPTLTHKPLSGSPAIDRGSPPFCFLPMSDQCGRQRVFGARVDIGSFEQHPPFTRK